MEELLQASIASCRQMLCLLDELAKLDLERPQAAHNVQERLAVLRLGMEETDDRIMTLLEEQGITESWKPLLLQRQALQSEIIERNRELAPRLSATMALLQAELDDLRRGRRVMAGYAPGSTGRSRGFSSRG